MSKKKFGRVKVKVNGVQYESMPGASIDIGGTKRTSFNADFDTGFTEETKNAECEFKMPLKPGLKLDDFRAMDDVTLTFVCDTGQTYLMTQAWISETVKLAGGSPGLADLKFESPPAKEIM